MTPPLVAESRRPVAVITVVAGRHDHLRVQRSFLAERGAAPDLHVVVAVDDPGVADVVAARSDLASSVIAVASTPGGLPIAAARNAGARAALEAGAATLVFLDVDCIPSTDLVARLSEAVSARPDAVVCGPVTYLPPAPAEGWNAAALAAARRPHPARPDPPAGELLELSPKLFWSLSFAVDAPLWRSLGGFYEGYVGYGAEDTDFAVSAADRGTPILLAGGADAFHQHHPVSSPPVEHLDDILRNSALYVRRHGELPMRGWLDAFAGAGLVERPANEGTLAAPRRVDAIRLLTVPARHGYLDAVVPDTVARVATGRVTGWEPDPLLRAEELRRAAGGIDVIHLHFGYDHLDPARLEQWLAVVADTGIALAVTVHDLRNPHHDTRERHDHHLRLLLGAADRVLTLTDAAARQCAATFGRLPEVVPHPSLLPAGRRAGDGADDVMRVLVPLKSLRRNVRDPLDVVRAVRAGAQRDGARVQVLVEPGALETPALAGLPGLDVDLDVTPYLPHDELCERVAGAHAVVLPYRFGTHSGWVELCRDLGTHVVAPDCGHYRAQWARVETYVSNETAGLDARSLRAAVERVLDLPCPAPAVRDERAAQADLVRAAHDALYRQLARR